MAGNIFVAMFLHLKLAAFYSYIREHPEKGETVFGQDARQISVSERRSDLIRSKRALKGSFTKLRTDIAMSRFILKSALALSFALLSGASAYAGGSQIGGGIPSLNPTRMLIIGGIAGGNRTDPASRNCYGSTLCKESGSYYTEEGVLNYKNGDPLIQRGATSRIGSATSSGTSDNTNHMQWCSNQYRSYRASDNSYQPFAGVRKTCNSPF